MLSKYKSVSESKLQRIVYALRWINPNILTILGIIPQLLFFLFMLHGNVTPAAAMLVLSPIDMLDGLIARANNKVTKFGGFLDSSIDRIGDFLIIAGLYAGKLAPLSLTAVLLLFTFMISYVRSRAELASNNTIKFDHGIIERPERIIYIFIVVVLYAIFPHAHLLEFRLSEVLIAILVTLSAYTFSQRMYYAYTTLDKPQL